MGRKKLSNAEHVRRYIAKHPEAKPREIAAALAVPIATVYAAKHKTKTPLLKEVNIDTVHTKAAEWQTIATVTSATPAQPDLVNNPPHYTAGGIETIDFLQAKLTRDEFIGYLKGNVLKYGSRLGKKGDVDTDAGKMAWYALKLRDMLSVQR